MAAPSGRHSGSQIDANLAHTGLAHDANHKVDWQQTRPNHAPVINTGAKHYEWFTGTGNAPAEILVSKPFHGIFSDPDGDDLTYSVSVPSDQRQLVEMLEIHLDEDVRTEAITATWRRECSRGCGSGPGPRTGWKAISPMLADPVVVTVTLTATDPGGLSASLDGGFRINWQSQPELESAAAYGQAITLTFDVALEDTLAPAPGQFTVNAVNGDGTSGTVAVNSVALSGATVTLKLASELSEGQTVTVDYAHDADSPLQRAGGGDPAPGFSGQAVDMSQLTVEQALSALRLAPVLDTGGRITKTFTADWDPVEDVASYTLSWWHAEGGSQAQSPSAASARQARAGSGTAGKDANSQTVNQRSFPTDQTSAIVNVAGEGTWNVRLYAHDGDGEVVAQTDSQIELKFYGTDNVSVIYWYDCQTTPRNRIEARPVVGGLEVRWHEDNEPVTRHQYAVHPYMGGFVPAVPPPNWTVIPGDDVDSYTIRGLQSGVAYSILLRTVTNGRYCFEWLVYVTPIDPAIGALTGLTAARVPGRDAAVKLTWDDPNDSSISYDIQHRGYSLTGRWTSVTPDSSPAASGGVVSATVSGITKMLDCASYDFRVRARRGSAVGSYAETSGYGTTEIRGTDSAETLTGGAGDECIYGLGGDDTLSGGAGDDRLDGGAGADALDGGADSDTADYSRSGAAVTVDLGSSAAQSGGHAQGDTLTNIENVIGSSHADTLTGDASNNILRGGDGGDTLNGGAGSDTADYSGSPATAQKDSLPKVGVGVIVKLASGEISAGHAQGDTLTNIENVIGTDYHDLIIGDASVNVIWGAADDDYLFGDGGNDTLHGGGGHDIMYGDGGDDTLHGGGGRDWIHGEAGDDTLYGGPDADIFRFRVEKGIGADTIEDYGRDDKIEICRKFGTPLATITHADVGSDYVITVRRSSQIVGTITVKGITSKSSGFKFPKGFITTETGSCWGGKEYFWK